MKYARICCIYHEYSMNFYIRVKFWLFSQTKILINDCIKEPFTISVIYWPRTIETSCESLWNRILKIDQYEIRKVLIVHAEIADNIDSQINVSIYWWNFNKFDAICDIINKKNTIF